MVTRSVLHVGPGGPGVPPHTHDGSEIEGTADLIHLRVDQLLAGTITGKEVILAGGAAGVIRSDNFVSGVDGWAIFGDGSAEFNDVVVRGTIVAGTGSEVDWSYIKNVVIENADITSLEFSKITAGENDSSLTIGAAGSIASANYSPGSAGFIIEGTGDAEFNDVTVRGAVIAGAGSSIDWGYIDNVSIGSADITDLSFDKITAGSNDASLVIGASGSISSANYAPGTAGFIIKGDGTLEANTGTFRGTIDATAGSLGALNITGTLTMNGGSIQSGATGFRAVFDSEGLAFYDNDTPAGGIIGDELGMLVLNSTGNLRLRAYNGVTVISLLETEILLSQPTRVLNGSASAPALSFLSDTDSGLYHVGAANNFAVAVNGTRAQDWHWNTDTPQARFVDGSAARPGIAFIGDADTGIYRSGSDIVAVATGGTLRGSFQPDGFYATTPNATGSAANLVTAGAAHNNFMRSTSARRYKTEITYDPEQLLAVELRPAKFYRPDDDAWYYGFIADDLAEEDPLLGTFDPDTGEIENYDQRAVMAVMAAKLNEMARRVADLEERIAA